MESQCQFIKSFSCCRIVDRIREWQTEDYENRVIRTLKNSEKQDVDRVDLGLPSDEYLGSKQFALTFKQLASVSSKHQKISPTHAPVIHKFEERLMIFFDDKRVKPAERNKLKNQVHFISLVSAFSRWMILNDYCLQLEFVRYRIVELQLIIEYLRKALYPHKLCYPFGELMNTPNYLWDNG